VANQVKGRVKIGMDKKYFAITGILILILAVLIYMPGGTAYQSEDSVDISVQISSKTAADITPNRIRWTAMLPGTESVQGNVSGNYNRPGSIQIENTGSTNITWIWFNTSYPGQFDDPTSGPMGSDEANGSHDGANFVVASAYHNETYYWVNRVDYNETTELVYLNTPAGWSYGRIRNGSTEYFWAVDGSVDCNGTTLRIGITPHTVNQDGDTNFDPAEGGGDGSTYNEYTLTAVSPNAGDTGPGIGVADVVVDGETYCAAVSGCGVMMLYKWNKDAPGADTCGNDVFFWENDTHGNLAPGNSTIVDLRVRVPYGVNTGDAAQGTFTISVTSEDAT